jgi:conjugative transposon TraJ protein
MKKSVHLTAMIAAAAIILPLPTHAQDFAGEIHSLQSVLDRLYEDMMPLCSQLIGVGRGLAAFGALFYIASRVWRQIANAEPIDLYPLLRPFAIGMAILLYPAVLSLMNGILKPTVTGTAAMFTNSNNAIQYLLRKKEEAIKNTPEWKMFVGVDGNGDRDKWFEYTHPDQSEWVTDKLSNDIRFWEAKATYRLKNTIKQAMAEVLHVLYEAAALCINTIRTFYLVILSILGPLVFGFAVFDGLQNSLMLWVSRYINVFLWLPVANIFGSVISKIQENMLRLDLAQIQTYGSTFFSSTDAAYLVFMIIGIIGYFTVPSISNYIVQAGGGGHYLMMKTTSFFSTATSATASMAAGSVTGIAATAAQSSVSNPSASNRQGTNSNGASDQAAASSSDSYQTSRLSGKS